MKKRVNLTRGDIKAALISMALPIMATSFVQMAYNLTDMIWIGINGSKSTAAVGTAGFYTWLAMGIIALTKSGCEINVSQSYGAKDYKGVKSYVQTGVKLNILIGAIYTLIVFFARDFLVSIFNIEDKDVLIMASDYLKVISFFIPFYFLNPLLTGILNGYGDSKTPFKINVVGLFVNMILDPALILGIWFFPKLGVKGAALATGIAQLIVCILFIYNVAKNDDLIDKDSIREKFNKNYARKILKIGIPVSLNTSLFCGFSMAIASIIGSFGAVAIAVQKVGSQIESISWMTSTGFATALGAFVGQNYGAKQLDRIKDGYKTAIKIVFGVGMIASLALTLGAKPIFYIFLREDEALNIGIRYLQILGLSQFFMCVEITLSGAFNGLGKTKIPAYVSIIFTGARIPIAIILSKYTLLGLDGVWWTISITSMIKGIIIYLWFNKYIRSKRFKESFHIAL